MDTTPEFAVPEPVMRPMDLPQTAPPSKVAAPPASKISVKSLNFFPGNLDIDIVQGLKRTVKEIEGLD